MLNLSLILMCLSQLLKIVFSVKCLFVLFFPKNWFCLSLEDSKQKEMHHFLLAIISSRQIDLTHYVQEFPICFTAN